MQYNSNQIQAILPHRHPFLLVDRIIDGVPGEWATGIKAVTANEYFFCGHFPQEHIMPGVLIIEALAQVGAVAILSQPEYQGKIALFRGIRQARFRDKVVPGDLLELTTSLIKMKSNVGVAKAKAQVNKKTVAEAELIFAIQV